MAIAKDTSHLYCKVSQQTMIEGSALNSTLCAVSANSALKVLSRLFTAEAQSTLRSRREELQIRALLD